MTLGRVLIWSGLLLACVGVVLVLAERWHIPLVRLPGDIFWRRGHNTVYFPVVTCLLVSLILSLFMWLAGRR